LALDFLEWENTTPTKNQLKMLWRLLHTYEAALSTEFIFAFSARVLYPEVTSSSRDENIVIDSICGVFTVPYRDCRISATFFQFLINNADKLHPKW